MIQTDDEGKEFFLQARQTAALLTGYSVLLGLKSSMHDKELDMDTIRLSSVQRTGDFASTYGNASFYLVTFYVPVGEVRIQTTVWHNNCQPRVNHTGNWAEFYWEIQWNEQFSKIKDDPSITRGRYDFHHERYPNGLVSPDALPEIDVLEQYPAIAWSLDDERLLHNWN